MISLKTLAELSMGLVVSRWNRKTRESLLRRLTTEIDPKKLAEVLLQKQVILRPEGRSVRLVLVPPKT